MLRHFKNIFCCLLILAAPTTVFAGEPQKLKSPVIQTMSEMDNLYKLYTMRLFLHLKSKEDSIEGEAAEHQELLKLGDQIVPILIDFVQSWRYDKRQKLKKYGVEIEDDHHIRGPALQMLGELRAERAFDLIVKELKEESELLNNSITALSFFKGNKRVLELILPYLNYKRNDVLASGIRECTALSLGRLGDTEAIPYLEEFIKREPARYMKNAGRRAIRQIKLANQILEQGDCYAGELEKEQKVGTIVKSFKRYFKSDTIVREMREINIIISDEQSLKDKSTLVLVKENRKLYSVDLEFCEVINSDTFFIIEGPINTKTPWPEEYVEGFSRNAIKQTVVLK